jgi:hypothetical protein
MRKHQAKPTLRAKQWCLPNNIIKRFWTQYLGQRRRWRGLKIKFTHSGYIHPTFILVQRKKGHPKAALSSIHNFI